MKKILLSALVIILAVSLIACGKFTEGHNSSNASSQRQAPSATGEKTVILKGKDLKGAELTSRVES